MGMLIDGNWADDDKFRNKDGKFVRPESIFRHWITPDGSAGPDGQKGFKAEPDRYHLYVTHNCPWAYRSVVFRKLKGLEGIISIAVGGSTYKDEGWTFNDEPGAIPDSVNNIHHLHELYTKAEPAYTGRVTVPTLWDKKEQTIVSNESSEIIRMFNSSFDGLTNNNNDYYPVELSSDIDVINETVYANVNNGVYRTGFAATQEAYEEAFDNLFNTLDDLEERLAQQRYLVGDRLTEADWRLFSTLLRFDIVYYGHFKCNKKHIYEYPNLWNFTLELYQHPGVAEVTNFDHIKRGYYHLRPQLNPLGTVAKGPALDFNHPHDREKIIKA
ncbi:MAG TPA: glutathione S-transferase family protein, partial [Rhodospirillales bacterium]|nr:glutathione S-transferase family protein [Rhodospirillales bacterium]